MMSMRVIRPVLAVSVRAISHGHRLEIRQSNSMSISLPSMLPSRTQRTDHLQISERSISNFGKTRLNSKFNPCRWKTFP